MQQMCRNNKRASRRHVINRRHTHTHCCSTGLIRSVQHSRGLVHLFVDLLDRQLDVVLDAVEDVLEIRLLVYFKLQKKNKTKKPRRDRNV